VADNVKTQPNFVTSYFYTSQSRDNSTVITNKKRYPESNLMEQGDCFLEVKTRAWKNSAMEWRVNPEEAEKIRKEDHDKERRDRNRVK